MAISSSRKRALERPRNIGPYRRSFLLHVHELVRSGYARLDHPSLKSKEEPAITGLLVGAIRAVIESPSAPRWAQRYSIHDDPPLGDSGVEGKKRPRVDIEVERTQAGPHPRFQFEAKRLHDSDSVAEYVGSTGLGCFLSGRYSRAFSDAGMLGYVQNSAIEEWTSKIHTRLDSDRKQHGLPKGGSCWSKENVAAGREARYRTEHTRHSGKRLTVHHTFLRCH